MDTAPGLGKGGGEDASLGAYLQEALPECPTPSPCEGKVDAEEPKQTLPPQTLLAIARPLQAEFDAVAEPSMQQRPAKSHKGFTPHPPSPANAANRQAELMKRFLELRTLVTITGQTMLLSILMVVHGCEYRLFVS